MKMIFVSQQYWKIREIRYTVYVTVNMKNVYSYPALFIRRIITSDQLTNQLRGYQIRKDRLQELNMVHI